MSEGLQRELFAKDAALAAAELTYHEILEALRSELERDPRSSPGGIGVTADDARPYLLRWRFDERRSKNFLGQLFRVPGWRCVGTRRSKTPGSHGNELKVWIFEGVDR